MKKLIAAVLLLIVPVVAAGVYLMLDIAGGCSVSADTKKDSSNIKWYTEEDDPDRQDREEMTAEEIIDDYASQHGLTIGAWPRELIDLLDRNPETEEFVLGYPYHNDADEYIDISGDIGSYNEVPEFYQWDMRWGYKTYGSNLMGLTGCGPTCLSMVAVHLLGDTSMNPAWMADYAMNNGYYDYEGMSGTCWTLMSDGATGLGLEAIEITSEEQRIIDNLEAGNPIICIMGPGVFTDEGHFIVITGYSDGKFTIHDPNSIENTQKEWEYDEFADQILNIWTYRLP